MLNQYAGVDGHVIHALLRLLLDYFEHQRRREIFNTTHPAQSLIDRHRTNRNRRLINDRLADERNVAAGGQVHYSIGTVLDRVAELL